MFERKHEPLAPRKSFYSRMLKSILFAFVFLIISLFIGMSGYHWISGFGWTDSLLNASMILAGMGPVNTMPTEGAKIFASFYAIFSGVAFLSMIGVVIAPVAHRFLHKFHLQDVDEK
jgi:hypothetical protein